ncbi:MAG: hypothetical protein AABZ39_11745 [Spirochaetota bacterium]
MKKNANNDDTRFNELFENCKMDLLYYHDFENEIGLSCSVRVTGQEIVVSSSLGGEKIILRGKGIRGHYNLKYPQGDGNATLHRFTDGKFLEGQWSWGGARGLWIIWLG